MRHWERPAARAGITRGQLWMGIAVLLAMATVMAIALTPRQPVMESPEPLQEAGSAPSSVLSEKCQVVQTLTYAPCGHAITRRQALPPELVGKTREDAAYVYESFRITGFSAEEIEMEQALDMFCPEHVVLMPNESGILCIFENRYGDALALVRELETRLADLPDSYQEELRPGKGFDSLAELESWLESIES